MYCERFRTTLTTECCLNRQEKAKNQSETTIAYCESLIFCFNCPQGNNIHNVKNKKLKDLDVVSLKSKMIKDYCRRMDYSMFKIKRKKLKRSSDNELLAK